MPKESDRKTRKGLLDALKKVEDVQGTLANIDPEFGQTHEPLRLARGLAFALGSQLYHLLDVVLALAAGKEPPQMALLEVLKRTEVAVPGVTDGDLERVEAAVEKAIADDRKEPPKPAKRKAKKRAAKGRKTKKKPADEEPNPASTSSALFEVGRNLPAAVTSLWTPEEQTAAREWARLLAADPDSKPEPPEVLTRVYLEDLDLDSPAGREHLFNWLDMPGAADFEWTEEMWSEVLAWATTAARYDRGEEVVVLKPPEIVVPEPYFFGIVKATVFSNSGALTREEVIAQLLEKDIGVGLAIDALLHFGELDYDVGTSIDGAHERQVLVAKTASTDTDQAKLVEAATLLAKRTPLVFDLDGRDPDGELMEELDAAGLRGMK